MPGSHNAKRLRNIVENYPRTSSSRSPRSELLETSLGILHLYDRAARAAVRAARPVRPLPVDAAVRARDR
jgi:NAD-specific glutamate dehydrogenase